MPENKLPKMPNIFTCDVCHFVCSKQSNWKNHLFTLKHQNLQNPTSAYLKKYECNCGKIYKHSSTYYAHKKKCKGVQYTQINTTVDTMDSDLIVQLLKQNDDFKTMLLEQNTKMIESFQEACKINSTSITNNNNNTNHTVNSHNKTFNMNVFLNEHCKNAMNISEFVDSIQPGYDDLINIGKVGYVEGISSIIIKKLRSLDIHMRPMHSGDEKRHSMYIKEDGKWAKQPDDNKEVRKMIRRVAFKNTGNTVLFKEKYPDCVTSASRYSDQYNKIVMESYGGRGASTDEEKENKIVKMIAKEVYIDKSL